MKDKCNYLLNPIVRIMKNEINSWFANNNNANLYLNYKSSDNYFWSKTLILLLLIGFEIKLNYSQPMESEIHLYSPLCMKREIK